MPHRTRSVVTALIGVIVCTFPTCLSAQSPADPDLAPPHRSASTSDPDGPSVAIKSRPATYKVDFRVSITAPANTKQLRVWLPLPPSNGTQQISDRKLSTFPGQIVPVISTEAEFGNQFAYFEFDAPDGAQLIEHTFTAQISQLDWNVDYASVRESKKWPQSFAVYQRPDPRSQQSDDLNQVLSEINQSTNSQHPSAGRLLGAMRWVDKNLTYDHQIASLSADPNHALQYRRGHCSDYHGLCSTLARNIGFPSRVLYGLQMFDKGSPSHCKMEVFLPPYGWVRYDLSETQKFVQRQPDLQERISARTKSGFSENTWLQVTRGVNYELAPPASKRVALVRTIYAEADGKPLPESDPSNPEQSTFAWMTMHGVTEVTNVARRFDVLD